MTDPAVAFNRPFANDQGTHMTDEPRLSDLTPVVVAWPRHGDAGLGLPVRKVEIRTSDLPRLRALLDELEVR